LFSLDLMRRRTKALVVVGAVFALVVITEGLRERYAPITDQHARAAAETRFAHLCRDFHLQRSDYAAAVPTTVGGADFAWEWKSKRPNVQTVLIYVAKGGLVEATWLDK
jgi:hypothetical protein